MKFLLSFVFIYTLNCVVSKDKDTYYGSFWQLTDIHYDVNYSSKALAPSLCLSTEGLRNSSSGADHGGPFGDHNCDSPWQLVASAIDAMKNIDPNPDFILWTGDSVPHVPDYAVNSEKVFDVMKKVGKLLIDSFPGTPIFPTIGNHDVWPAHQMPNDNSVYYQNVLNLAGFDKFFGAAEKETFLKGGYYTSKLAKKLRLISVNSNLWYNVDHIFDNGTTDPSNQFSWMELQMQNASRNGEQVLLMGHIPPGVFGRSNSVRWLRPMFNQRFHSLLQRYSNIIVAGIFGHEHTDGFRIVSSLGSLDASPAISMFMAPAVTPWFSTLPGTGSNNPGIRLFNFTENLGSTRIIDYSQYFINLTLANAAQQADWIKEYQATKAFNTVDVSPSALYDVILKFIGEPSSELFDRYYLHNSVSNDLSKCVSGCKTRQICAALYVDFTQYDACVNSGLEPEYAFDRRHHGHESTTLDPHHHDHPRREIEKIAYFVLGILLCIILVLFIIIAFCCCHRRHAVVFFRRSNYFAIQESA